MSHFYNIYTLPSLWSLSSDTCHLLANSLVLRSTGMGSKPKVFTFVANNSMLRCKEDAIHYMAIHKYILLVMSSL
jgi:hypothetical protein